MSGRIDLDAIERRVQHGNWTVSAIELGISEVLALVGAARAALTLTEHIDLNGGCHRGCPEHDAAVDALAPFREAQP